MDGTRFDTVVRSLAIDGNRRRLLRRGGLGLLAAALGGLVTREPAVAACRGGGQACRRDDQCCSGTCRNSGTCTKAGIGDPCKPNRPEDCRSGECGCTKRNTAGKLIDCTCRRATCSRQTDAGCTETADCCDGRCLTSRGACLPPAQQCIPEGASCASAPNLCCPGLDCIEDVCTA